MDKNQNKIEQEQRESPLMRACREDRPHVIQALVKYGAAVNGFEITGDTPLHILMHRILKADDIYDAEYQFLSSVECLIHHGADIDLMNEEGETPFTLALVFELREVLRLMNNFGNFIVNYARDDKKLLQSAIIAEDMDTIDNIMVSGFVDEADNVTGMTALKQATLCGNIVVVDRIIGFGSHFDQPYM